ncbi:unnamed protein product [Mytilus coruscus]|uniref:DDE Tnp4 domain-containing protein n=1 Tax=Mytilus coruscus TaxID=42192 RepID=A0A6J8D8B7_MYTCO|nr:unnamed protein product [Mytilus coruscus]
MSWLSQECLERFAGAVFDRDGPLDSCWGFIDGTVRPICRPQENQRLVFNGHKRSHALKFQSIVTPNGIISNSFGPIEGRRYDAGMLRESDILTQMRVHMTTPEGRIFCIYGDPAYPVTDGYIIAPFRGGVISNDFQQKNVSSTHLCGVGFWKSFVTICISRLQEKSKVISATRGKVLQNSSSTDKLPYLSLWQ